MQHQKPRARQVLQADKYTPKLAILSLRWQKLSIFPKIEKC